tara:strand:- start:5928 stop:6413 length:486 start_codon:yes stop_codon:yes gene_type:complete
MNISQLLEISTKWFGWAGIFLVILAFFAFLFKWGIKFRLVGTSVFTLLLAGSCWAFNASYSPPSIIDGAIYAPIVYDNGFDLVVAQAPEDFPEEAIQPTLNQLANNLKGRGRNGSEVTIRLRKIQTFDQGKSKPIILGEIKKNIKEINNSKLEKSPIISTE